MKKQWISLFWFFIYMASCVSVFGQPQTHSTYYYQKKTHFEQLPNAKREIIFLGDSIIDGGEWSEVFGCKKIKNRGISGDVTQGVLDRLEEVTESKPKKVFLMIGINDLARGKTTDYVIKNTQRIIGQIRESSPKTKIFIQSILPVNNAFEKFKNHTNKDESVSMVNLALKTMESKNVVFVNLHKSFINSEGKLYTAYTNDGLHLNGSGYAHWVKLIKKLVK